MRNISSTAAIEDDDEEEEEEDTSSTASCSLLDERRCISSATSGMADSERLRFMRVSARDAAGRASRSVLAPRDGDNGDGGGAIDPLRSLDGRAGESWALAEDVSSVTIGESARSIVISGTDDVLVALVVFFSRLLSAVVVLSRLFLRWKMLLPALLLALFGVVGVGVAVAAVTSMCAVAGMEERRMTTGAEAAIRSATESRRSPAARLANSTPESLLLRSAAMADPTRSSPSYSLASSRSWSAAG
jgi:hypothetical protein